MHLVPEVYFVYFAGDSDTDHRIIGGRPANDGEFPYQVIYHK